MVRLLIMDRLIRQDHSFITEEDECYFLMEYIGRGGFDASPVNDFISNLKMSVKQKNPKRLYHKNRAISDAGILLREALEHFRDNTFVPVPPSKKKDDPEYDDRLMRILAAANNPPAVDIRELIFQTESYESAHCREDRPRSEYYHSIYQVYVDKVEPRPSAVVIFDDMVTAGSHYMAMKKKIIEVYGPDMPIKGLFLTRRIFSE